MPRRLADIPMTLWLTLAALVIFCVPAAAEVFEYDRVLVAQGELWRLVTCHLTHWSFDHLLWDALTFALLGILCERQDRRRFLVCLCVSAALISAGVCLFLPEMATYRGLSGIDTGLFTLLAVMQLRERLAQRRWDWVIAIGVLLAACVGKMVFEVITGDVIFVDTSEANFVPLPLVHVIGAVVGAGVALAPATLSPLRSILPCAADSAGRYS